jgi:hypothetical protein
LARHCTSKNLILTMQTPDMPPTFESRHRLPHMMHLTRLPANQKELVTDLVTKAKQIEYLINSLPEPEPEETQACISPTHQPAH